MDRYFEELEAKIRGRMLSWTQIRASRRREHRLWLMLRYLRALEEHDDQIAIAILVIALSDRELRDLLQLAERPLIDSDLE